jgi:uncharacterized protein (DUF952 family)
MADDELYRLALAAEVPDDAWKRRLEWTTAYKGVPGLDDGFIHLSTAEQVVGTAELYFKGKADLMLLSFSTEAMVEEADLKIRWEDAQPPPDGVARAGAFPHAYGGAIPYACLSAVPTLLPIGPDGKHVFPPLGQAAAATAAAAAANMVGDADEHVERGMDDEDGYDGGAARGMWG